MRGEVGKRPPRLLSERKGEIKRTGVTLVLRPFEGKPVDAFGILESWVWRFEWIRSKATGARHETHF